MNRKKEAVILIMSILLDYCHGYPTSQLLSREGHGHLTPEGHGHLTAEGHGHPIPQGRGHLTPQGHGHPTLELFAREDVQQRYIPIQQQQQKTTIDKDDLAVLTEFLGEHDISLTDTGTSLCADAEENEFYKSLKGNSALSVGI